MGAVKIEIDSSVSFIQIIVNIWCEHLFSHLCPEYDMYAKSIYDKDDGQEKKKTAVCS